MLSTLPPKMGGTKHASSSILGFEKADWQKLEKIIFDELPYHEALLSGEGKYGKKFLVSLTITGLNEKTGIVETVWIIRTRDRLSKASHD
jgi:hypothetical protein